MVENRSLALTDTVHLEKPNFMIHTRAYCSWGWPALRGALEVVNATLSVCNYAWLPEAARDNVHVAGCLLRDCLHGKSTPGGERAIEGE